MGLFDYKDRQFAILVVSKDSWEVLRNFRLPDDMFVFSNMEGFKRKKGDIEITFFSSRDMGITRISELEVLVTPKPVSNLDPEVINELGTGFMRIKLLEEEPAVSITGDLFGLQPIYYTNTPNATIISTRREWLSSFSNVIFELPAGYELTASLYSLHKKRILQEEKLSSLGGYIAGIKDKLEKLSSINSDLYFHFDDKFYSRKLLELMITVDEIRDKMKIITDEESMGGLKKIINGVMSLDSVLLFDDSNNLRFERLLGRCEIDRSLLEKLYRYISVLDSLSDSRSIIIKSLFDIVGYDGQDAILFSSINQSFLEVFRALFKCAWPSAIVDPYLDSRILLYKLEDIKKHIVGII